MLITFDQHENNIIAQYIHDHNTLPKNILNITREIH